MRFVVFVLIILYSISGLSQMRFSHIKVEDGLSQSSVNFVIRDKKGFYWIGTQYGLNKYDGKNIQAFFTSNTPQLTDNFILSAVEDVYGNLWFATRNNLCKYDIHSNTFHSIITDTIKGVIKGHNNIVHLFTDKFNNIVFSTYGNLYYINKQNLVSTNPKVNLYSNQKTHVATYFNTKLYSIVNDSFYVYDYDNEKLVLKYKRHNKDLNSLQPYACFKSNYCPIIINDNNVFLIKNDSLLLAFKNELANRKVYTAFAFYKTYYVGTDNGLYVFSEDYKLQAIYQHHLENPFSLSENNVLSISLTNDSTLWIGNSNTGVNYYNFNNGLFSVIKPDANKPYVSFCCYALNDSVLYAGTNDGYDEFVLKHDTWQFVKNNFKGKKVISIREFKNKLFIGTSDGLYLKTKNTYSKINLTNNPSIIFDINTLNQTQLLISTTLGIYIIDANTLQVIKHIDKTTQLTSGINPLKTNYIFNSLVTPQGVYVNSTVGSSYFNVDLDFKYNVFENYKYKSLSEIMITKSIETKDNTLWFGSLGNGIYKKKDNVFTNYNNSNGLSNNVIASIEKDNSETIWVSTNYGIDCITNNSTVYSFVKPLAIESPEFMTNGSYAKGNQLFFCSNSGLITFDANKVLTQQLNEKLNLITTLITKNYTDTLQQDSIIHLNHTDKIVSFSFCVPTQNYYNNISLFYRLVGFDEAWHTFENGKLFSFINLPFGSYTLEVKGELKPQRWQQLINYKIVITPPFWKKPWFILLMIALAISFFAFIIWYLSRLKLKRQVVQMQINQKIFEEKDRISKDLHDNIGSQISTLISGLDKITITKTTANAERLSDYARNTLSELRETIWALNTDTVDLQILKNKLEELVFELRTNYDSIELEFSFVFSTNHVLNTQQALSFYRILQEAANNAIKHASCTKICINLGINANLLRATIIDNGKGFDTTLRKKGHYGLDNMNDRASKLSIDYQLQSKINHGTRIILSIILNDNNSNS